MTVRVRQLSGPPQEAEVLREWEDRVRVRFSDGKERTVRRERLVLEREAPPPASITRPVDRSGGTTRAVPKEVPVRSRSYLAWLRKQPCCVCGRTGATEASHHGAHGTGTKPSDMDAIGLCTWCHRRWHDAGSPAPAWDHLTRAEKRARFAFLAQEHRARFEAQGAAA